MMHYLFSPTIHTNHHIVYYVGTQWRLHHLSYQTLRTVPVFFLALSSGPLSDSSLLPLSSSDDDELHSTDFTGGSGSLSFGVAVVSVALVGLFFFVAIGGI